MQPLTPRFALERSGVLDAGMSASPASASRWTSLVVFVIVAAGLFVSHFPLLRLPYFWDEAGYYIPAARDLLLTGSLIPHSTLSNAHPPLVMAYLAMCWKLFGFSPVVTRSAMLVLAAFSLLGLYRLATRIANPEVAWASVLCTALYPVFFAQSSMAHVDLAAAGLTFWALEAYFRRTPFRVAIWFSLAVLAKETALLAPLALFGWEWLSPRLMPRFLEKLPSKAKENVQLRNTAMDPPGSSLTQSPNGNLLLALLVPVAVLVGWYAYHYTRTGYVFGNPEFFRYNVRATLSPLRIVLALLMRLWQTFGYLHLFVLTFLMAWAMTYPPLHNGGERPRIAIPTQCAMGAVIAAYVVAMAIIGGAVLARYMLPVVPLVIILAVSTLWRRMRVWPVFVGLVAVAFVAGWFINPPYGFAPEDNLAYRDYIAIHQRAARFLENHYPGGPVLTAWPASDELSRPYLGYVNKAIPVLRAEDFSAEEVMSAAEVRARFNAAFLFSTKYEPTHPMLERWRWWRATKERFFGFHQDLPPTVAAQILGGHVVFEDRRDGQWVAVVELERAYDARRGRSAQDAMRWQECVLTTSQTSRPSAN